MGTQIITLSRRLTLISSFIVVVVLCLTIGVIVEKTHRYRSSDDNKEEDATTLLMEEQEGRQLQDNYMFPYGVASFDPSESRVIIWTRVETTASNGDEVYWVIGTDESFSDESTIVHSGKTTTNSNSDYTIAIDVYGLQPYTYYYYRFQYNNVYSTTGRTKTAPSSSSSYGSYDSDDDDDYDEYSHENNVEQQIRFAVVSCNNYQGGWFHAFDQIYARDDLDAVIHLGDYIYEYEDGVFQNVRPNDPPGTKCLRLDDYRNRYAQYRREPPLQRLHSKYPFITTWDDHEYSNDAYRDGSADHDDVVDDGITWQERKNAANQAYREWLPFRVRRTTRRELHEEERRNNNRHYHYHLQEDTDKVFSSSASTAAAADDDGNKTITSRGRGRSRRSLSVDVSCYRKLQYGNLVDIFVLDNRILARDMQPDSALQGFNPMFVPDFWDEDRKMLGQEQMRWIQHGLKYSQAKWKIIVQPVVMTPNDLIPGLISQLPDSWNGYSAARSELIGYIATNKIDNVVVLSGDVHATVVADIPKERTADIPTYGDYLWSWPAGTWFFWKDYTSVAVEFVVTSVSSANLFDEGFGIENIPFAVEAVDLFFRTVGLCLNNHIKMFDALTHGYQVVDFQPHQAQTDIFITGKPTEKYDTLDDKKRYQASYKTRDGKNSVERTFEQTKVIRR